MLKLETIPDFMEKLVELRFAAICNEVPIEDGSIASLHWLSAISLLEQAGYQMHLAAMTSNPSRTGASE